MKLNSVTQSDPNFLYLPSQFEHPIAIDGDFNEKRGSETEKTFTLHGTNELPLEEQCPNCVIKISLTGEEKSLAQKGILSGMWLP
jgi:hypothetical protein